MRKETTVQTNFTSGELSPNLIGRSDIERYGNCGEVVENFVVRDQGALVRRLGSQHHALAAAQSLGSSVRTIEFIFSRTQSRTIEVSAGKFRFYYSDGTQVMNGGGPYEVTGTPYTDADIPDIQFAQSADVLFITHSLYPPATLSRYSDTNWVYSVISIDYGPYMDQQVGDQDISLSIRNVTDSAFLNSTVADFASVVVGSFIEYSYSGQRVLGQCGATISSTVTVIKPLEDDCLVLSKEVYSPGIYTGWDSTNNIPTYSSSITGSGVSVAFSATSVITQEHIGTYVRFCDQAGTYYWMLVTGVDNIIRQGAYGIIAIGNILSVIQPAGIITRSTRTVIADLISSNSTFFTPLIDLGRTYRLVLGDEVVHAKTVIPTAQFPKTVALTVGSAVATLGSGTNTSQGITVGLKVFGVGIPYGTTVTVATGGSTSFTMTAAATTANPAATEYIGTYTFSRTQMPIAMYRSLPRSTEGTRIVQNGTTNDWNKGSFYVGNYPSSVAFHEQRLAYAGTAAEPQTGWLSRTADYYNFASTDEKLRVLDTCAITFSFASDTVNQILWLVSRSMLIAGTVGGEWKITSGSTQDALTPSNISVQSQSSYGSEFAKPLLIGRSLIYIQRGQRRIWEMTYDFQSDDLVSVDVSIFADHVLRAHGGAKQLTYQLLPESTIYVRLGDGQVGCLTYEPVQKIYAWSRFIMGGPNAFVESMACIPDGTTTRLFLVVRRVVNATYVRSIESITPEFRPSSPTDKTNMLFMDSYQAVGIGSASLTGLTRFANCNVCALIDDVTYTSNLVVARRRISHSSHYPTIAMRDRIWVSVYFQVLPSRPSRSLRFGRCPKEADQFHHPSSVRLNRVWLRGKSLVAAHGVIPLGLRSNRCLASHVHRRSHGSSSDRIRWPGPVLHHPGLSPSTYSFVRRS